MNKYLIEYKIKKLLQIISPSKFDSISFLDGNLKTKYKNKASDLLSSLEKQSVFNDWYENESMLLKNIIEDDIHNFLNWPVIKKTMNYTAQITEFHYLKESLLFNHFKDKLKENKFGSPKPYPLYPHLSGNMLHHCFSLSKLIEFIGMLNFLSIENVLECGAGYGSMTRIFQKIGLLKNYNHFDLKPFLLLQTIFLSSIFKDLIFSENQSINKKSCVNLISDINILNNQKVDLLIGLWSISEMPLKLRSQIFESVTFKYILIAFQESYLDVNNFSYFSDLVTQLKEKNYHTSLVPITEMPKGNWFLFAKTNL